MSTEYEQPPAGLGELGPVQVLTVAFDGSHFKGEILPELDRLKALGLIRLIDLLLVRKDELGSVAILTASDLDWEEAADFGGLVGSLIGWGVAGAEGAQIGWMAGTAEGLDGHVIDEQDRAALLEAVPNGASAAIALIEHVWAKPLRDAIRRADGIELANDWLRLDELVRLGMAAAAAALEDGAGDEELD